VKQTKQTTCEKTSQDNGHIKWAACGRVTLLNLS